MKTEEQTQIVDSFTASDVMTREQFFARIQRRGVECEGELWLCASVLGDALDCYRGVLGSRHINSGGNDFYSAEEHEMRLNRRAARIQAEAADWIFDVEADEPFSFNWICDALGIEASALRERLARDPSSLVMQHRPRMHGRAHALSTKVA